MIEKAELSGELLRFNDRTVKEVMTPNPVTVDATSSLEEACREANHSGDRSPFKSSLEAPALCLLLLFAGLGFA